MQKNHLSYALIVAIAVLPLASCGSSAQTSQTASSPSTLTSSTPTSTTKYSTSNSTAPAPKDGNGEISLTGSWSDSDGYTYKIKFAKYSLSVTEDVADAKPGNALIKFAGTVYGSVQNTTTGHNAEIPLDESIAPAWRSGSSVCSAVEATAVEPSQFYISNSANPGKFCTIGAANTQVADTASTLSDPTPAANQRGALSSSQTIAIFSSYASSYEVSESTASTLVSELKSPPAWAIFSGDALPSEVYNCGYQSMLASGNLLVSTVPLGCGVKGG